MRIHALAAFVQEMDASLICDAFVDLDLQGTSANVNIWLTFLHTNSKLLNYWNLSKIKVNS